MIHLSSTVISKITAEQMLHPATKHSERLKKTLVLDTDTYSKFLFTLYYLSHLMKKFKT